MCCDELVVLKSFGYEMEILIVDIDFDLVKVEIDILSIELICINCDLFVLLIYGLLGGDLSLEGGGVICIVVLLCKLMLFLCFECGCGV